MKVSEIVSGLIHIYGSGFHSVSWNGDAASLITWNGPSDIESRETMDFPGSSNTRKLLQEFEHIMRNIDLTMGQ